MLRASSLTSRILWRHMGKKSAGKGGVQVKSESVLLPVVVVPSASRTEVTAVSGCGRQAEVRLRLSAPPVDGEANRELVRFLARACGAARADVQVVRGHRSRDKVVAIEKEGLTLEALLEELREHV